jgi:hydroxypyruvate isomerase
MTSPPWPRKRFVANCSILFADTPVLERPAAARDAGFEMIESWWPFDSPRPDADAVTAWIRAVESAEVHLVAMNLFSGDLNSGDRGILVAPDRGRDFDDAIRALEGVATQLGCEMFNAPYGRLDPNRPVELQHALARERLERLAEFAARLDAMILLEPMSGIPDYPLTTAADALAVIASLREDAREWVGLLADLYHLGRNGDDVDSLLANPGSISHVQIADAPGRHEPGTGSLPLMRWLEALDRNGYDGRIALEYEPSTDPRRAFDWLAT